VNERTLKDGAIEATVRLSSGTEPTGRLLFRYGPRGGYYAGVGGRNAHFAIRKFIDAKFGSVGLAAAGHPSDVRMNQPYELRVEFVGSRIVLRSSGVTVLEAEDSWFQDGHIGLNCYGDAKTEVSGIGMFEVPPVAELVEILERLPYVLRRDYEFHKRALGSEADVQRVLWTMLRSHYKDLVDEEYLGKFGLKHYKDDFGIPSLDTVIEVKVIRDNADLKRLQEEMMIDVVGYFATLSNYRHLIFFIYNMANRALDHKLVSDLLKLEPVAGIVIVPGMSYP
jgi:hypothetical protein